jgi:glycerol-3-phosphate dehydrogenase
MSPVAVGPRDFLGLESKSFDTVVVGGGIYGASIAWEAARQGLRVCLLEAHDFGGQTSSNSLRVVHGGLRYLQHLDLARMRESIRARRSWLKDFPELVRPLEFRLPTNGRGLQGPQVYRAALLLNDLVSLDKNRGLPRRQRLGRGRVIPASSCADMLSHFAADQANGCACWHDGLILNSERVVTQILLAAVELGAVVFNYARVDALLRKQDRVIGVRVADTQTGRMAEVRAAHVVNSTGPWCETLMPGGPDRDVFRPSRAFNLLTRRFPFDYAVGCPLAYDEPDKDHVLRKKTGTYFIVPWGDFSLVGTKHVAGSGVGGKVSAGEIRTFVHEVNATLSSRKLGRSDVLRVFEGTLPATERDSINLVKSPIVIDHGERDGLHGLITVAGIKWTTANTTAQRLVRRLRQGSPSKGGRAGAGLAAVGAVGKACEPPTSASGELPDLKMQSRLIRMYGAKAGGIRRLIDERPELAAPIADAEHTLRAEIVWAVSSEMAVRLEDVIFRRTEIGLGGTVADGALEECSTLMGALLGWSDSEKRRQIGQVRSILESERVRLDAAFARTPP